MQNWETKQLGKLCNLTTGKKDANEGDPNGIYRFYTCAKDFSFINDYIFDTEAVLISGNGEYVGYVHYYKGKFDAYQRTYVLDNFTVNIRFIYHYLSESLKIAILRQKQDTATPYITRGLLHKFPIYLPNDIEEQKRIAYVLDKTDKAVESTKKTIEKAKRLKKSLMQNLLTGKMKPGGDWRKDNEFNIDPKFGKVPKGWEVVKVKDLADITMGQSPDSQTYNFDCIGLPFVQGNADMGHKFPEIRFFTSDPKKVSIMGDILLTVRAPVGDIYYNNIEKISIGRGISALRENDKSGYLYYYLIRNNELFHKLQQGTTFTEINQKEIRNLKILIPKNIDDRKNIVKIIDKFEYKLDLLDNKLSDLQKVKKSLMQHLLTGKIRIPEHAFDLIK